MPTLPYANKEDVKVFGNEYINVNTINRALLRLYYNDSYLAGLSSLNAVDSPTVANMLLVSTGPAAYTWKTTAQAKTLLNITDSVFGLSDVDEVASNMLQGYTLSWDATKKAFVGAAAATELDDLDDVTITTPANLHSLLYSSEYGKFINGYLSDFAVGYVTHVTLEDDGKVILPEVTTIGQQIVITKIGIGTSVYIIPDSTNKINGQTNKVLKTYNTGEIVSTIHLRSVIRDDASIEWVIISSEGTFTYIDSSLVPGSSILIRTITNNDLMLAPYSVTLTDVPDASSTTKGIVRLATEVEAQAGTLTTVAVTPYGVKYWFDNYAVPFATNEEAKAGVLDDVSINPSTLNYTLKTVQNPFINYALFRDEKASGVLGALNTPGTFDKRNLTEKINNISGCSIDNDVITLPSGTYILKGYSIMGIVFAEHYVLNTAAGIFNGDSALVIDNIIAGSSGRGGGDEFHDNVYSFFNDQIVLENETYITLRHYCNVSAYHGVATNTGIGEVYAELEIWKLN